jgi:hypothetical protein
VFLFLFLFSILSKKKLDQSTVALVRLCATYSLSSLNMWIFVFFFLAKLSLSFLTSSSFDGWKEKFQFLDSCQNDETRVSKIQENISSLFSSLLKTSKSFVADYEAATAKTKESYFWEQRTQHWMKMIKKWFWERRNCSKHRRLGHAKQKIFFFINSIFWWLFTKSSISQQKWFFFSSL